MSTSTKGIYLALATAVISGFSIFINKFAVDAISPALYFTSIKNLAVALLVVTVLILTKEWKSLLKLSKKELGYLVTIGIVGGSLPFYLYFTGLAQTPAVNAAIIHKTLIFWVLIMAIPFLKEKISKGQMVAVLLLFLGNIVIGGFKGFAMSTAELMLLAATILWAVENVLAKKVLVSVAPTIIVAFRMGLGSLILMTATLITVPDVLTKSITLTSTQTFWLTLTVLSLFAYVTTWYKALKHAPAVVVASVLVSSTLITNLLSALFITHSWNASLTIQSALLLSGLVLFWKTTHQTANYSTKSI